jgi:hypothetical protein
MLCQLRLWQPVQVGDQLDRGDNEIQILYFLERLQREAEAAGGKLHILNGNHETMNVAGRFTYATLPALASFYEWQAMHSWGSSLKVCIHRVDAAGSLQHLSLSMGVSPAAGRYKTDPKARSR